MTDLKDVNPTAAQSAIEAAQAIPKLVATLVAVSADAERELRPLFAHADRRDVPGPLFSLAVALIGCGHTISAAEGEMRVLRESVVAQTRAGNLANGAAWIARLDALMTGVVRIRALARIAGRQAIVPAPTRRAYRPQPGQSQKSASELRPSQE
jgi:hypothetical protein